MAAQAYGFCVECWNDRHKELAEAVEACRKDIVLKLHNKEYIDSLARIFYSRYLATGLKEDASDLLELWSNCARRFTMRRMLPPCEDAAS